MTNYTYLLIGLIYTTFLPGFVVTELLLPKLELRQKLPLYFILSAILSCFISYAASIVFGFRRETLMACFLAVAAVFVILVIKKRIFLDRKINSEWKVGLACLLIYLIFFVALSPAIFKYSDGSFIMSGPNWQDTAMHISIIESLTQGNFPPQAPYFSGQPLSYYYFSDFHAAIVNTFFGKYFPEILILLNPFWAVSFFLSVYALAYKVIKRKSFSLVAAVASVLYGNLAFIDLIKKMILQKSGYISLITNDSFNGDQNYFQMVSMSNYFLQNRPMMVGLPAVILIILLLIDSKDSWKKIFLAGLITGGLMKFQMFGFVIAWGFFGLYHVVKLLFRKIKITEIFKNILIYGVPSLLTVLLFASSKIGTRSMVSVVTETFVWEPWQKHPPIWFLIFFVANFGLGIVIFLWTLFLKRTRKNINVLSITLLSLILIVVPLCMKFTIYEFDMLKFYYYLTPLVCILVGYYFARMKKAKLAITVFVFLTLVSSFTSINLLVHSYLNKTVGYSLQDYESGMWIRENTPEKSVFVTMPTVHSAPTDIGGRLRIISYINWPYSHGFNTGDDNVFSRVKDVTGVYKSGDVKMVQVKYNAKYIYYGGDERGEFPDAWQYFDKNMSLKMVYDKDNVKIYEIL
jgi:hypothetical protein